MGYFSDLAISMSEEPNITERDTHVCKDCVVDEALQLLVDKNLSSKTCSYCGEKSSKLIAASFNVIMLRIYETISTKYADAQDLNMPWVEGGWLTDEIYTTDVVGDFDPGWNGQFLDDIIDSLDPMTYWAEHSKGDWAVVNPSQALHYGWESFKNQILTKTRYLALSEPEDEHEVGRPDYIPISNMLDALGYIFEKHGNIHIQPGNTEFFRVRAAKAGESFTRFEDLGLPPVGVASGGRMNPPGISYFYIALDEATATAEVIDKDTEYFVGRFKSKKDLRLVDFVRLPQTPSLFEPKLYDQRHSILFLYQLKDDLIKPVSKDGREHIEYIPTQVISEYFRYRFKDSSGDGIDGFIYPSIKKDGGINIVVFESENDNLQRTFTLQGSKKC